MAFSERLSIGTSRWLSALTKPCPGKCLPQLCMPDSSRPCIRLLASSVTTRASRCRARSPMTLLAPKSRSSTGVKLRSTPQARSSAPSTWPAAVAASVAARASFIHSSPKARIGGRCVKPSVRKRCTRPPSWSTQISTSGRIDLISLVSSVSWRRFAQLRANRIKPPVSGCASRLRSAALRFKPSTSSTTGACAKEVSVIVVLSVRPPRTTPRSRFRR